MRWILILLCFFIPFKLFAAEMLSVKRVMRVGEIINQSDLSSLETSNSNGIKHHDQVVGKEVRKVLYPGRMITVDSVGEPTIIQRNQIVSIEYMQGGLAIFTEGRALSRAGLGEYIKILNLSSRNTVSGTVMADGTVRVNPKKR